MEFGILIPGIPLPEKSQKECGLREDLYLSPKQIFHTFSVEMGLKSA